MKKSGNTSKVNQNIQVYVRLRPLNLRERHLGSSEVVDVISHKEIITRHNADHKLTKKFTFDRIFDADSKQVDVYTVVVAPLIEEVLAGYNCTVFAYGQTGTGKTHTMVGNECVGLNSTWYDDSEIGIIPRALSHLFDELRMLNLEFSMRISYLELYNEELCDLLSSDDSTKIRIFDDNTKKGSVIIQGLEEIPVHNKDDVYKLLEKGKERRKTATTLMNAQSSRSHTVFSILVHIKENGIDGEEMLKIGKLNLVDLAGSENVSKAGNEKAIRVRETVNINQSLLTLGRVITALVERTPHIPYRESKLTRLLQESLGGRTKTSIIATVSPGHKDIEETLSTLEYAHRAKNIQNKPEVNQKLTKKAVIKEYTEEIDRLKRELMAAREKNGIYLPDETYNEMLLTMDSQNRELNEKILLLKALKDELTNKERVFNEVSLNLVEKTEELIKVSTNLSKVEDTLQQTQKMLYNTKRRYQEKNVVLQSHMKTEEILTRQAHEIMQVADTATKHTHALHETIERRKSVDEQIQTACERFSQRMHDHFDSMDANLNDFEKQHNRLTIKLNDELNANIMLQIKHMEDTDTKLKAITAFVETTMKDSCSMTESFTKDFHQIGEEQKEEIMKFLENFKQNELVAMKKIKDDLTGLTNHNLNKKSIIMETCDNFMQIVDANTNTCRMNNAKIKDIFKAIEQQTRENLQELQQISANIATEQELLQEERKLIAEFQQNLNVLHAKHDQKTLNTMNSINLLNNNCEVSLNTLRKGTKLNETITTEQEKHNELVANFVREQSNVISNTFDHNIDEYSNLEKQINEMQQMNSRQLNVITEHENSYHDKMQIQHNQHKYDANNLAMKISEDFRTNANDIRKLLEENYKHMENHDTVMKTLNADGQSALQNYCHTYQEQVAQCAVDVNTFKTNELKTYSATGQTPSKREFKYPRVLATTSPHMRIVKRYRLENDCSDIETTIPIHHEEIDCTDESIIQDNSIPFHSTPSIEPLKSNSSNDLSVQHPSAEGYLSNIPSSPQKRSSLTTPVIVMTCYNSENKENINQSSNLIDKQQ